MYKQNVHLLPINYHTKALNVTILNPLNTYFFWKISIITTNHDIKPKNGNFMTFKNTFKGLFFAADLPRIPQTGFIIFGVRYSVQYSVQYSVYNFKKSFEKHKIPIKSGLKRKK